MSSYGVAVEVLEYWLKKENNEVLLAKFNFLICAVRQIENQCKMNRTKSEHWVVT